jgi:hypothetical protein
VSYLAILLACVAILAGIGLLVLLVSRYYKWTSRDIEGIRDAIDGFDKATQLEHEKMGSQLKRVDHRTQFLAAKSIAEELAAEKANQQPKKGDPEHE